MPSPTIRAPAPTAVLVFQPSDFHFDKKDAQNDAPPADGISGKALELARLGAASSGEGGATRTPQTGQNFSCSDISWPWGHRIGTR